MLDFFTSNIVLLIIIAVIGYLLGSVNSAVLITRAVMKNADIRTMGSGNAGFTNVLRSVGKGPAIFTITFDFIKGVLSAVAGSILVYSFVTASNPQLLAEYARYGAYIGGLFCILGHMFPVYFGFKGGKGVVTSAALMAVVDIRVFALVLLTFLIVFLIKKIISLASLVCAVLFPVYTYYFAYVFDYLGSLNTEYPISMDYVMITTGFAMLIGLLVIIMHRKNIGRLIRGEEKKITSKKKQSS